MQNQLEQLEKDNSIEWQEHMIGDLFEIQNTLSFNKDKLTLGAEYDYVTRTSQNQGILQKTGFVNQENINSSGVWSLGLLQMDFFYRQELWYAGQFVRKIAPKIKLSRNSILYFTVFFNKQKKNLLSGLVRDVDKAFLSAKIQLPTITQNGKPEIAFDFIEKFIATLNAERIATLNAYLIATNLKDYTLTTEERKALKELESGKIKFVDFTYKSVFNRIAQGRRLKKEDQISGNIPFVMAGTTNTGVVNHISNPVAKFPKNSITIDIFGNTFYRDFDFGAGDDTGVYWNDKKEYSKEIMLFLTASMGKSIFGKFDFGKKLRSSQSLDFTIQLPINPDKTPNYDYMSLVIGAMQKVVIKNLVEYLDVRIDKTAELLR